MTDQEQVTSVQEGIAAAIEAKKERVDGRQATLSGKWERGFNQGLKVAARIAREFRAPVTEPVAVEKARRILAQHQLHPDPTGCLICEALQALGGYLPPVSDDTTTDETVNDGEPEYVIVQPGLGGVAWLGEVIDGELSPIGKVADILAATPSPVGGVFDTGLRAAIEALVDECEREGFEDIALAIIKRRLAAHPAVDR